MPSDAAIFACTDYYNSDAREAHAGHHAIPTDRKYCYRAVMVDEIKFADAHAFRVFLRREPYLRVLSVQSPGGSIDAAIGIGRLIRSRFMQVRTETLGTDSQVTKCRSYRYARKELTVKFERENNCGDWPEGWFDDRSSPPDALKSSKPLVIFPEPDNWAIGELKRMRSNSKIVKDFEQFFGPGSARKALGCPDPGKFIAVSSEMFEQFRDNCVKEFDCRVGQRCCMSACVLIALASTHWDFGNLGLHRPTLKDHAVVNYEDVTTQLTRTRQRLRNYLTEMGVPDRFFEAMMEVPQDDMLLLDRSSVCTLLFGTGKGGYDDHGCRYLAPNIYDWFTLKCPRESDDECNTLDVLDREFMQRATNPVP